MAAAAPTLTSLVELVDSTGMRSPLERLGHASRVAADLRDLGERLLDHYVLAARSSGASWAEIGAELGVTKQGAQQRFALSPVASGPWPDRFTDSARAAVAAAADEARTFAHSYIGTEHVLLGLLTGGDGIATQALATLGVTPKRVHAQIEGLVGRGPGPSHDELGISPRLKRAFEDARRIAKKLGHDCVRSEHLLLALAESDTVAARILVALDAPPTRLREVIADRLAIDAPELAAQLEPARRPLARRRGRL